MDMLNLTKQSLDQHQALTPSINTHAARIMSAINTNVPERMKALIAQTQITAFASQFRRNLKLWDDSSIPINAVSFCITGSGEGKDSSVKAARKCFKSGYEMIDDARNNLAAKAAMAAAREAGETLWQDKAIYKNYAKPLPPLDIRTTTGPGFIQHVNDLGEHKLGAGMAYSGEFADELAYNQDMLENIKIISELYDSGDADVKYTKSIENRSKAISGQPVSALYVSSPSHILHDTSTSKKFQVAFMSKLARRAWFCYTPEAMPKPTFDSIDDMIAYEYQLEEQSKTARESMKGYINRVAEFGIATAGNDIGITEEVFKLYKTYLRYNAELADTFHNQHSTAVLVRRHLQWKALKLAGALAIFDLSDNVEASHYIDAIRFCELLANDISIFEAELNKADHERMSDYIQTLVEVDGRAFASLHELKKRGFTVTTTYAKLKELATLANAYDTSGIYTVTPEADGIHYERIIKSDVVTISFKPINTSKLDAAVAAGDSSAVSKAKSDIAASTAYGFETHETTFADLANLLQGSYAYSAFKFDQGIRGKDHIQGGTKWCVIDIDNSNITAEEAHFMLSDINHHIALTSDPNNTFKFRVLVELDSVVELNAIQWRYFFQALTQDLGLQADQLPQAQIHFSYPGRTIYSQLEASPLPVRDYLVQSTEKATSKAVAQSNLTAAQRKTLLDNPESTFVYAFEAPHGAGSRMLIRAAHHARDLGMDKEAIIQLISDINDYWSVPMNEDRLEQTVLSQIRRW